MSIRTKNVSAPQTRKPAAAPYDVYQIREDFPILNQQVHAEFGSETNPLLVSVRSGARASMPGMMDTILNVGLNPECVRAAAQRTGHPRAAWDAYHHFVVRFGQVVGGIDEAVFANLLAEMLREWKKESEDELDRSQVEMLCERRY